MRRGGLRCGGRERRRGGRHIERSPDGRLQRLRRTIGQRRRGPPSAGRSSGSGRTRGRRIDQRGRRTAPVLLRHIVHRRPIACRRLAELRGDRLIVEGVTHGAGLPHAAAHALPHHVRSVRRPALLALPLPRQGLRARSLADACLVARAQPLLRRRIVAPPTTGRIARRARRILRATAATSTAALASAGASTAAALAALTTTTAATLTTTATTTTAFATAHCVLQFTHDSQTEAAWRTYRSSRPPDCLQSADGDCLTDLTPAVHFRTFHRDGDLVERAHGRPRRIACIEELEDDMPADEARTTCAAARRGRCRVSAHEIEPTSSQIWSKMSKSFGVSPGYNPVARTSSSETEGCAPPRKICSSCSRTSSCARRNASTLSPITCSSSTSI